MKKEHFDLFNEVCLEAELLKVVKSMHDFIRKTPTPTGTERYRKRVCEFHQVQSSSVYEEDLGRFESSDSYSSPSGRF